MLNLIAGMLAGLLSGLIVNYLADVLPFNRKLSPPLCLKCQQPLTAYQFLISYLQCPHCSARKSIRTYSVSVIFILVGTFSFQAESLEIGFFSGMILAIYLGVVAVIDIEHRLILHPVSMAGVLLGGVIGVYLHGIQSTLTGGAVGFLSMLIIYLAGIGYVRLAAWFGRPTDEVALGYGDVNLSGVIGLILGWPGITAGLVITILLAGLISLGYAGIMILRRRYRSDLALPFGPFLVASAVILLYLKDFFFWVWQQL